MRRPTPWRAVATCQGAEWPIAAATVAATRNFSTFAAIPCQATEDFSAAGPTADGIIAGNAPYTHRILAVRARVKKVISRPAVGDDRIAVAAPPEAEIAVGHVPDYCTDEVSDRALALLLTRQRRVPWLATTIMVREVTAPEPPLPGRSSRELPALLLTPHSAYYSGRARLEVRRRATGQILAVLRGEQPLRVADPIMFEQGWLRTLRDR